MHTNKISTAELSIWIVGALIFFAASVSVWADDGGFKNESSLGIVVTSGNSKSQSYNLNQLNTYAWDANLLRFDGKFLKTSSSGTESARYWLLGLRYERSLTDRFSLFLAQNVESDIFAGYLQRYNSDLGGKYFFTKQEDLVWLGETGYRYTAENRVTKPNKQSHFARIYTEAEKQWSPGVSSKLWIEFLPNFSDSNDWNGNTEFSTSAALTSVFSVKTAYLLKFDHEPAANKQMADSTFTTSLVAKF